MEVSGALHASVALPQEGAAGTHRIAGLVDRKDGLYPLGKRQDSFPYGESNDDYSVYSSEHGRYTDRTVSAPEN